MPQVLDEDEFPFVLGVLEDQRPSLEVEGARYRRCRDGYLVEWPVESVWLRARAYTVDPQRTTIMALAGPLLNDWWPILRSSPADPARPFLSAGAAGQPIDVAVLGLPAVPVNVTLLEVGTVAVIGLDGTIADADTLHSYHFLSLTVIRAAIEILGEYRALVGQVPDVQVQVTEDQGIPLEVLLDAAADLGRMLAPRSE